MDNIDNDWRLLSDKEGASPHDRASILPVFVRRQLTPNISVSRLMLLMVIPSVVVAAMPLLHADFAATIGSAFKWPIGIRLMDHWSPIMPLPATSLTSLSELRCWAKQELSHQATRDATGKILLVEEL